jgi:hypothetical protein
MSKSLLLFLIVIICSCKKENNNKCRYTLDDLLQNFDTSLLVQAAYKDYGVYEVTDVGSNIGVKGIYKFDKNKTLRFYAFLLSDSNDYIFSRSFDTAGNIIGKTGKEVVQWYFRKLSGDSVKVTFFLFGLHQNYNNVQVKLAQSSKDIKLVKSPIFSNILGGSIICSKLELNTDWLFITGKNDDECLNLKKTFLDSAAVLAEFR